MFKVYRQKDAHLKDQYLGQTDDLKTATDYMRTIQWREPAKYYLTVENHSVITRFELQEDGSLKENRSQFKKLG